jgi:hypothetical protein
MHELLEKYDACGLECDGLTRVLTTVLQEHSIPHVCVVGTLTYTGTNEGAPVHFWIDLPSGERIDYRARMWLGERPDVPHGIFDPADFPGVTYQGHPIPLEPLAPALFAVLTMDAPA